MNFFLALLAWTVIAVVLGVAIFATAVKGVIWALPLVIVGLVFMVYHYGCKTH